MDAADWLKSESEVGNCNSITQAAHLWSTQTFAKVATATSDECCLCNCPRCCRRAEFTVCLSDCRSCHEGRHWMFWCCRSTYCVVILQLVNKLLSINDRGCADCIIVLANPNTWPWLPVPRELWSWPIYKIKLGCRLVQKLTVKTDGQTRLIALLCPSMQSVIIPMPVECTSADAV